MNLSKQLLVIVFGHVNKLYIAIFMIPLAPSFFATGTTIIIIMIIIDLLHTTESLFPTLNGIH